jgi:cell division protein FtsB
VITKIIAWVRNSVGYLWLVIAAVYLSVLTSQAVIRNYQSQQDIKTQQQQLLTLDQQRDQLQALLVYYATDSFKEKELRRDLLLKGKGEKVYALPESSYTVAQQASAPADKKVVARSLPVWQQWVRYLEHGKED